MKEASSQLKPVSLFWEYLQTLIGLFSAAGGLVVFIAGAFSSDLYHSLLGVALSICGVEILRLRMRITDAFSLPALRRRGRVLAGLFSGYVSEVTLERMLRARFGCNTGLAYPSEAALLATNSREFLDWFSGDEKLVEEKRQALQRFRDELRNLVYAQEGMVITPYKDGISALWGVPVEFTDGADRALKAALEISEFTTGNSELPEPFRRTTIALHYGETKLVLDFFMNYSRLTPAGSDYYKVARLDELNKVFGRDKMEKIELLDF